MVMSVSRASNGRNNRLHTVQTGRQSERCRKGTYSRGGCILNESIIQPPFIHTSSTHTAEMIQATASARQEGSHPIRLQQSTIYNLQSSTNFKLKCTSSLIAIKVCGTHINRLQIEDKSYLNYINLYSVRVRRTYIHSTAVVRRTYIHSTAVLISIKDKKNQPQEIITQQ
jgi:hypothetical protein